MSINIKRCYFHSIEPLKKHKFVKKEEKERRARLNCMLNYGFLVPGRELPNILPEEYKEFHCISNNDCVYLAQHILTELPSIGGSFHQGEFSAYFEHIFGHPSLVFDEHVVDNKKIKQTSHFLSEEICIQGRIPLSELIAIALPYATPLDKITSFIRAYEELDTTIFNFKDEMKPEITEILEKKEKSIMNAYKKVQKYQKILTQHHLEIPCIRYDGTIYDIQKEIEFVNEKEEKVRKLIKQ